MLFSEYGTDTGPTNASAALMKQVRNVTKEKLLVVHSLRHNLKDRFRVAGVSDIDQNLILGHSLGGVGNRVYGGEDAKLIATTAAMEKAFSTIALDEVSP
jgi:hypothetical protein